MCDEIAKKSNLISFASGFARQSLLLFSFHFFISWVPWAIGIVSRWVIRIELLCYKRGKNMFWNREVFFISICSSLFTLSVGRLSVTFQLARQHAKILLWMRGIRLKARNKNARCERGELGRACSHLSSRLSCKKSIPLSNSVYIVSLSFVHMAKAHSLAWRREWLGEIFSYKFSSLYGSYNHIKNIKFKTWRGRWWMCNICVNFEHLSSIVAALP